MARCSRPRCPGGLFASVLSAMEAGSRLCGPRLSTRLLAQRVGVARPDLGACLSYGHQTRAAPPILRHRLIAAHGAANFLAARCRPDRGTRVRVRADGLAGCAFGGRARMAASSGLRSGPCVRHGIAEQQAGARHRAAPRAFHAPAVRPGLVDFHAHGANASAQRRAEGAHPIFAELGGRVAHTP